MPGLYVLGSSNGGLNGGSDGGLTDGVVQKQPESIDANMITGEFDEFKDDMSKWILNELTATTLKLDFIMKFLAEIQNKLKERLE